MKWPHMEKMNRKMLPHPRPLKKKFFLSLSSLLRYVCHISVIRLSVLIYSYGPCGRSVQSTLKRLSFIIVQITCCISTEDNSRPFSLTIKAESCKSLTWFQSFIYFTLSFYSSSTCFRLFLYHTLCLLNFIN